MAPKQKPNAFLMFMLEFKKRQESRGHTFRNGLRDVQNDPQCNKEWQSLPKATKDEYARMAKSQRSVEKKQTGTGEIISDVERQRREQLEFENYMRNTIETEIAKSMEFGVLKKESFFFIHANWFYTRQMENGELDYDPAEFAVAHFSLADGVTDIYHEILKTKIPTGFTREALETSQETHQLTWDLAEAEDRFDVMGRKLKEFLKKYKPGEKLPPLYTSKKIKPSVKALLRRMVEKLNIADDTFVVFELEILFANLQGAAADQSELQSNIKIVMAEYELIKDSFSFALGLECNYHKQMDGTSQFCSMSTVKRWAYTICDYCCENLKIKPIEGIHYPVKENDANDNDDDDAVKMLTTPLERMQIKSMTGVSNEHRTKVSERSDRDEERRRKANKPITIINHAERTQKMNEFIPDAQEPERYQRPLRPPNTMSSAVACGKKSEHTFSESDFPTLDFSSGRGNGMRRHHNENKPGAGRGRGSIMS